MCVFQTFLQKGKEMGVNQSMGQHLKVEPTYMFDVKISKKALLCNYNHWN